jgi:hypothetical protein
MEESAETLKSSFRNDSGACKSLSAKRYCIMISFVSHPVIRNLQGVFIREGRKNL